MPRCSIFCYHCFSSINRNGLTPVAAQVSSLQQQLQQSTNSVHEANQQLQDAEVAYLGMQQEAQHMQQDNEDLLREHDLTKEQAGDSSQEYLESWSYVDQ